MDGALPAVRSGQLSRLCRTIRCIQGVPGLRQARWLLCVLEDGNRLGRVTTCTRAAICSGASRLPGGIDPGTIFATSRLASADSNRNATPIFPPCRLGRPSIDRALPRQRIPCGNRQPLPMKSLVYLRTGRRRIRYNGLSDPSSRASAPPLSGATKDPICKQRPRPARIGNPS